MAATIGPNEPAVPDLTYKVPAEAIVKQMEAMGVSLVMIRVSQIDQKPLVKFVQQLKENGGDSLAIILSDSLPNMERTNRRKELAGNLAKSFNALQENGLGEMVKGCHLGENDLLNGQPSTSEQWEERFDQVLDLLTQLNGLTDGAFKGRATLIHGEGGEGDGEQPEGWREQHGKGVSDGDGSDFKVDAGVPSCRTCGWRRRRTCSTTWCPLKNTLLKQNHSLLGGWCRQRLRQSTQLADLVPGMSSSARPSTIG